jgi:hypothetical protein
MFIFPFLSKNKYQKGIQQVGKKARYDTLTDIVFISETLVVCADRQDKMLYLVEINFDSGSYKIIDNLEIPEQPDLMDNIGPTIYIVNLNNYLTICEIVSESKIILRNNIILNSNYTYHGLCSNPYKNELLLTCTKPVGCLTLFNIDTKITKDYKIPRLEQSHLKDIIMINKNTALITASDGYPKPPTSINTYKSYINLYTFDLINGFVYLDGITYNNCHIDSIIYTGGKYYVTAQLNDEGVIFIGYIENNFIINLSNIKVPDFPHGLAISPSNENIAFTCYSSSSLYITKISEL